MAEIPCVEFPVEFTEMDSEFVCEFDDMDMEMPIKFDDLTPFDIGTKNHPELNQRDLPNQHPMSSITALNEELAARPSAVLSNFDIFQILSQ